MLEKELRTELKAGKLRRAYLLCGEEDYLKRSARAGIRAAVLTDESFSSFNHTVLSAADTPPEELETPLQGVPMFSEKLLVEYRDVDMSLFREGKAEKLSALLARDELFDTSVLLLYAEADALDLSKRGRLEETLQKKFGDRLTVVRCDPPAPAELIRWVIRHLAHGGVSASPETARSLVERSGKSMDVLAGETDKLCCYVLAAGREELTAADLDAASQKPPEAEAFAMSNAILSGNTEEALTALSTAKWEKQKPTAVLAGITGSFSDMLTVKTLAADGRSESEIAALSGIKPYRVSLLLRGAARADSATLERCLDLCIETDGRLKSGASGFLPLETLLCRIAALRRGERV